MSTLKINQKDYVVPQLGFEHMVQIENMGFSVIEMFNKQQVFSLAAAFVGVVADCERVDAVYLCEQHVNGGGDILDIYDAFGKAARESAFFRKLLKLDEEEKKEKTKK